MNAESFIYSQEPYYHQQMVSLIGYSYQKMRESGTTYSREILRDKFEKKKGTPGKKTKLELEDYLRNDLVNNYVKKYQSNFDLENFNFVCGADEIDENMTVGSLDIKVLIPTNKFSESEPYFIIECKRIDKTGGKKRYYVDHGIKRFITRQYYPKSNTTIAGMLAFMESEKTTDREMSSEIALGISSLLNSEYKQHTSMELSDITKKYSTGAGFEIYNSKFLRNDSTPLQIMHLFLDYYDVVIN